MSGFLGPTIATLRKLRLAIEQSRLLVQILEYKKWTVRTLTLA